MTAVLIPEDNGGVGCSSSPKMKVELRILLKIN
jgi:hypothetical protein